MGHPASGEQNKNHKDFKNIDMPESDTPIIQIQMR